MEEIRVECLDFHTLKGEPTRKERGPVDIRSPLVSNASGSSS